MIIEKETKMNHNQKPEVTEWWYEFVNQASRAWCRMFLGRWSPAPPGSLMLSVLTLPRGLSFYILNLGER